MFRNPTIKNLGDILRRNAEKYPDAEGIVSGEKRYAWRAFNERVNRLSNGLLAAGITRGSAVACMSRNRTELIETILAANKIGSPFSPVNYRLAPDEVRHIIDNVEAETLIFDPTFAKTVEAVLPGLPRIRQVLCMDGGGSSFPGLEEFIASRSSEEPGIEVSDDDLAAIPYTSGTTGFPKGVMATHGNFLRSIPDTPFPYNVVHKANVLVPVSLFGAGALSLVYNAIYGAGKTVLMDFDPKKVLETIESEKIHLMASVPVMMLRFLDVPGVERYDLSTLKRIKLGAAPLSVPMLKKIKSVFRCEFQEAYGMCETMGILGTVLEPADLVTEGDPEKLARVSSAGRAQKYVEVRVVREDGLEVAPGDEVGEIQIKSLGNMRGYWKNPEATAKVLKDGWYSTGDLGTIDQEGYIFLVDRRSDMIKSGGWSIYPAEVEAVLANHPLLAEVAVFGAPDPEWGESVVAVVRLKQGANATPGEVIEFCTDKIAGFKKPKKVIITEGELPRNALGKVMRKELRKVYS